MDYIILIIIGVVIFSAYLWYASIISKWNKAHEALSGIDVQLQNRSNLIPNILRIAQKFMEHEKALLTEITELRTGMDQSYNRKNKDAVQQHLAIAEQLGNKMGQLMVAVEAYPELKSDQTMTQAIQTYNEMEAQIAAARRFYNSAVTSLNNAIQIFPGNLLAGLADAQEMPFYKAEEIAHTPVNANDYLR